MTYARREEILSKEVITTSEFAELMNMCYANASTAVAGIKRCIENAGRTPRITTSGRLHVQDYLDVYGLSGDRYFIPKIKEVANDGEQQGAGNSLT